MRDDWFFSDVDAAKGAICASLNPTAIEWVIYLYVPSKTSKSTRTKALTSALLRHPHTHDLTPLSSYRSLMSRYVLGPYWSWFVTLWPLSVAPNTVSRSIKLLGQISRELIFDITDHTDWLRHRFFQFFHNAVLQSLVSYGKTRRRRTSTLGVFNVRRYVIVIFPGLTRRQSSLRWALGLFLYQSLDAIDGYIL